MMYESQTFAVIMQRMLARVPDDIDKREGSVIYDALAPSAQELAQIYVELDQNLSQASGQTATGNYLDLRVADYGVTRRPATKAVHKGLFYGSGGAALDVPIGSRYSAGGINLVATSRIVAGQFELQCETSGEAGNAATGTLIPIDFISGLVTASLGGLLVPGTDTENDESLRKIYMEQISTPATSGNKAAYRKWALEVDGVGDAVPIPLWDGPGTVKVVLLDATKQPASSTLINDVKAYIDPVDGEGQGQAPIGATVTVAAATAIHVNVAADIVLSGSRTLEQVKTDFEAAFINYLKGIAFASDPSVKYARVGSLLLDVPGVQDYASLQLNGGTGNVTVNTGAVAIIGTVTFT